MAAAVRGWIVLPGGVPTDQAVRVRVGGARSNILPRDNRARPVWRESGWVEGRSCISRS